MVRSCLFFLFIASTTICSAQVITQKLRGRVVDASTGKPLVSSVVSISDSAKTITNDEGNFSLEIPVGRYVLSVSYIGYQNHREEIVIVSGKQNLITIELVQQTFMLNDVEIRSSTPAETPGAHSLSIEKTLRTPANFFDPVRVATSYPGIVASSDQNNSIIVRGNSPNGLLWRLNGLDIVNPNHLANAGTLSDRPAANGGGVNILSAQMLAATDLFIGSRSSQYGNGLSGVVDMGLRDGNNERDEYTVQASLIGLDVAAEGPITEDRKLSFLTNYRYSTVGLLSELGADFGGEKIGFQDLSLNLVRSGKAGRSLKLFGFYGASKNDFGATDADKREEDKERYNIYYDARTYATGLRYIHPLKSGKVDAGIAYSASDQSRNAAIPDALIDDQNLITKEKSVNDVSLLSTRVDYSRTVGKNELIVGVMSSYRGDANMFYRRSGCLTCSTSEQTFEGEVNGLLLQPFFSWRALVTDRLVMNAGVRYVQFTYNDSRSIEPRINLNWALNETTSLLAGYTLISQTQLPAVYLPGNKNLGLTKSHIGDIEISHRWKDDLTLKSGIFYQHLFDVPVQSSKSSFSVLNLMEEFVPADLINNGSGRNYGADFSLEKFFVRSHHILLTGSYYESTYTGSDGRERDSRFNGNYTLSAVLGREWERADRNRTISVNLRGLFLGGMRQSRINEELSADGPETIYDTADPFSEKMKDYQRIDFRISFRKNRPGYTRTLGIDIQNLFNLQNEFYRYYDYTQQKIVTKYHLGIIPVLMYRIDF